jgi:hypothetical protein
MTPPAIAFPVTASAIFLNFRSEVVEPVCFAVVLWDGPGDTLYAFEDHDAFDRQRLCAECNLVHVQQMSSGEAAS